MRINIYAEEMTDRVELISKKTDDGEFTGVRFYLELPVTTPSGENIKGPFIHHPGDDDSSAVTFWGKKNLQRVLKTALNKLEEKYPKDVKPILPGSLIPLFRAIESGADMYSKCQADIFTELKEAYPEYVDLCDPRTTRNNMRGIIGVTLTPKGRNFLHSLLIFYNALDHSLDVCKPEPWAKV